MRNEIIRNNVISIVAYVVLSVLTYIIPRIPWTSDPEIGFTVRFFIIMLLAIASPFLYFLCGRLLLRKTENRKKNILSVGALPIIIGICLIIPSGLLDWINTPLAVLGSLIAHSLGVIGWLLFALLPSAVFYIGMVTRKIEQ